MEWTTDRLDRLALPLTESTVFGLTADAPSRVCRLLLEVDSLPEAGPLDPDPRRVLVLSAVSSVEIMLREQLYGSDPDYGPAVPLSTLDTLNTFLASLRMQDSMYGWDFIDDDEDPKSDWPTTRSLQLVLQERPADHQLYWFSECWAPKTTDESTKFFLQGLVRFRGVAIERADGSSMTVTELFDDADRWWRAFHDRDPRVSVDAQRAAALVAKSWRPVAAG